MSAIREAGFVLEAPRGESTPDRGPRSVLRGRVTWPAPDGPAGRGLPWVLVLHGFKGFMDWGFFPLLCRRLAENGLAAVAFNTSGSGIGEDLQTFTELDAFAHASVTRQLEDVEAVASQVVSGGLGLPVTLDPGRMGLFGHSRGGGAGIVHAAERGTYRAVVTWAAIDSFDRWDEAAKTSWRKSGRLPVVNARTGQEMHLDLSVLEDYEAHAERLDVLAACGRLQAPTLLIHGEADEAVEPCALERLHDALGARERRRLSIPAAGHTFGAVHPLPEDSLQDTLERVMHETVMWFRDRLVAAPPAESQTDSVTGRGVDRT